MAAAQAIQKYYKSGSKEPEMRDNLPRLISYEFCPYVERVALVIAAKGIECEVVNVDLRDKPEWLFFINDKGKVPAFQVNGKTLIESMLICDYIEDTFDGRKLYPSDAYERYEYRLFVDNMFAYNLALFNFSYNGGDYSDVEDALKLLENELSRRGTPYIGGNEPMMVDYMIWPWLERLPPAITSFLKIKDWESHIVGQLPLTLKYIKLMFNDSCVQKVAYDINLYEEFFEIWREKVLEDRRGNL